MVPERRFADLNEVLLFRTDDGQLRRVIFDEDIRKQPTFHDFYFAAALDDMLQCGKITVEHDQVWYKLRTGHIKHIASLTAVNSFPDNE